MVRTEGSAANIDAVPSPWCTSQSTTVTYGHNGHNEYNGHNGYNGHLRYAGERVSGAGEGAVSGRRTPHLSYRFGEDR